MKTSSANISILHLLIKNKQWTEIIGINPNTVVRRLSIEDRLRLAYRIVINNLLDDRLRDYAVRLLYAFKQLFPSEWAANWKHEALLGVVCNLALKYDEKFFAFSRAAASVDPMPPRLAIELAGCYHAPGKPRVSREEAIALLEHVVAKYPYVDAILPLKSFYRGWRTCLKKARLVVIQCFVEKMESPEILPPCIHQEFTFTPPLSTNDFPSLAIPTKVTDKKQVQQLIRDSAWGRLCSLNPWDIVQVLSFKDSLRLVYRLIGDKSERQEFAVMLLYALKWCHYGEWLKDWHDDAFLGYACGKTSRPDEQVAAYLAAYDSPQEDLMSDRPLPSCVTEDYDFLRYTSGIG